MEALKTAHFLSHCSGNKEKQQVVEFVNCACLRAEQLKLMNITQVSVQTIPACLIDIKLLQPFFYVNNLYEDKNRKWEMLESVFVSRGKLHHISPLILRGGGKRGKKRKSDLSFHGQLMMSYRYTQILRSPSKPAPLRADWLLGCERGRVFFLLLLLLSLSLLD